jgi:hypothetical protein
MFSGVRNRHPRHGKASSQKGQPGLIITTTSPSSLAPSTYFSHVPSAISTSPPVNLCYSTFALPPTTRINYSDWEPANQPFTLN